MKIFTFTGILILIMLRINAQDFAPLGAKWFYNEGFAASGDTGFFELTVVKDTIIDSIRCKMITKNKIQECSTRPMTEYMYEDDSDEVYFYDGSTYGFQKIWDFNPSINESWSIRYGQNDTMITYIVDSISQIVINGHALKQIFVRYKFHHNGYEYFTQKSSIIEDIGDINYFFPWNNGVCDINFAQGLRCYHDSIIGDYFTGITKTCDYTHFETGINNPGLNEQVKVFPNPTNGIIKIKSEDAKYLNVKLSIFDMFGRLLISEQLADNETLDLSDLESGVYQMILYNHKNIISRTKILKY